ncbi:MAG TPA: UDP-3-O-(3-hydroxymyristoyl)glucosamine N-acyltransferase, partial [Lentisphaeria bacterium]|nr:UDP-3-O-(3-hydroxymyristoyl)glucosamine N-acyltransferase [Lentisphaeria bacterium]
DASFLASIKHRKQLDETKAGIVLVENGMKLEPTDTRTLVFCEAPDKAFTRLCNEYAPEPIHYEPGICPGAYVDPTAKLGENVYVGPNAVVQAHAEIGDNSVIGGGAYI